MKLELLDCGRLARGCVWLGCLLAASGGVWAKTVYVSLDGDDLKSGLDSWEHAVASISQGVAKADSAGDIVLVSNGTYNLNAQVSIRSGIVVTGLHGRAETFVNGQDTYRCFYINHADAVLDGFTITNGAAMTSEGVYDRGAGVYMQTAGGLVKNCVIAHNRVLNYGGGVYALGGTISNCVVHHNESGSGPAGIHAVDTHVVDCQIYGNTAQGSSGGINMSGKSTVQRCGISNNYAYGSGSGNGAGGLRAISVTSVAEAVINDCTIAGNWTAGSGGGIMIAGTALVARCRIVDNMSSNYGAGICFYKAGGAGGGLASNCYIEGNTSIANSGGGVYLWGGTVLQSYLIGNSATRGAGAVFNSEGRLENCVVASNIAGDSTGGAIYLTDNNRGVCNCTVVDNTSSGSQYGGIYCYRGGDVFNTISWGNHGTPESDRTDIYTSTAGANTGSVYNSCMRWTNAIAGVNMSNTTNDPAFAGLAVGNYRLTGNTDCIDKGDNQWVADGQLDLDGRRRIRYGIVDMGAYEYIRRGTFFSIH